MMDCTRYRRSMMAEPHDPDPMLADHRANCHDCNLFAERLLRFESRLERALRIAASGGSADRVVPLRRKWPPSRRALPNQKSWLALAASVLVAVVVAGGLWLSVPDRSLAADVVTHMKEEPQAWRRTDVPVPSVALQDVLRDSHMRMAADAARGSHAVALCATGISRPIRGWSGGWSRRTRGAGATRRRLRPRRSSRTRLA